MSLESPQLTESGVARSMETLLAALALPARVVDAVTGTPLYDNPVFGRHFSSHGPDIGSDADWRDTVPEGGCSTRIVYRDDGGPKHISHVHAQRVATDHDGDAIVMLFVDLSQELQLEKDLERALERLNRTQRLARIADFTYEAATRRLYGSSQLADMLGLDVTAGVDIGELLNHHVYADDREEVRGVLNSNPNVYAFTFRFLRSDGDVIWLEIFGSVVRDGDDEMRAWDGTMQDVTERMQAQEERERLNQEVLNKQKLESLGLLAGGVAHDFNNLLVAIMGNADIALMDESLPEATRSRLQDIITASQRAADLTGQLLAYSGKGRLVKQATDLSHLVSEMSELLKVTISRKSRLQLFLNERAPLVDVDPTQIRQVVMNIMMNAAESISHGEGIITVTTDVVTLTAPQIARMTHRENLEPGPFVMIEVKDNGHGMPQDVLSRLFEPFFTTKVTGRGLGLSAVVGIVSGHQGAMDVSSKPDIGTAFRIYLPVRSQAVAVVAAEAPVRAEVQTHRTVMVVDDDLLVTRMLERALKNMGYAVVLSHEGRDAIDLYRESGHLIDLVMLDLTMPGMDGLETFDVLRSLDDHVKVILMSGYTEHDVDEQYGGRDLAGFLPKPFLVEDLVRVLAAANPAPG